MKHSEEHKKAIGDGNRGRIIPQETREHFSKRYNCTYKLISPDDQILESSNLQVWSKENNLSYQCLLKVANGIKLEWLGWTCERLIRPCGPSRSYDTFSSSEKLTVDIFTQNSKLAIT